jgi:mRNA-degrading endonuclease RelE of RelBE toxin-antitoxin system
LCEITLTAKGSKNWDALKEETFRRFGSQGDKRDNIMPDSDLLAIPHEYYVWQGKVSEMELIYDPSSKVSELFIGSVVARERIFQAARQKKKAAPGDKGGSPAETGE